MAENFSRPICINMDQSPPKGAFANVLLTLGEDNQH